METLGNEMDGTVDCERLSEQPMELSFLEAKQPSILSELQRPKPTAKKNLMTSYEEEGRENAYKDSVETVKVYLKLKPLPDRTTLTKEEAELYTIINSEILLTKCPLADNTRGSFMQGKIGNTVSRKFTFSRIFGPETTQVELFQEVVKQKIEDFLDGHNSTLMMYGTTGAGKSFTMHGTTTSPGIIPQSLESIFSNVNTTPTPSYKPAYNSDVVKLSPVDSARELEAKNKIMAFASVAKNNIIMEYEKMQKSIPVDSATRPGLACAARYSVWVSFAEIYNEHIYDLLSNDSQKRQSILKLGTDSRGRPFVNTLKTVCVNSGLEAYKVFMAGKYNLKIAATAVNASSSRSHCIFTIKLLKYSDEDMLSDVEVSTFSFCDLAGSERLRNTLNVGERLKESKIINTGLLVLGRCLKAIYEGQASNQRHESLASFRESKLTRLFQRALSGKEPLILIVNVNPVPNMYFETQNVLNFAAIAKKIATEPKEPVKRRVSNSRFSMIVETSMESTTNWVPGKLISIEQSEATKSIVEHSVFVRQDEYDELLNENKSLKEEISKLKKLMLTRDFNSRLDFGGVDVNMEEQLGKERKENKTLRAESEVAICETNKFVLELGSTKEELKNTKILLAAAQEALCRNEQSRDVEVETHKTELEAKDDIIKGLKNLLDEAKSEYIERMMESVRQEKCITELENLLLNHQEQIADLNVLLEQTNLCLGESLKEKEVQEERLSEQVKILQERLVESENSLQRLKAKIVELENSDSTKTSEVHHSTPAVETLAVPEHQTLHSTPPVSGPEAAPTVKKRKKRLGADALLIFNAPPYEESPPDSPSRPRLRRSPRLCDKNRQK